MEPKEPSTPVDMLVSVRSLDPPFDHSLGGLEQESFLFGEESLNTHGPRMITFKGMQDEATVWLTTKGMYDTRRGKLLAFPPENGKVPVSFDFGYLSTTRQSDPGFLLANLTTLSQFTPDGHRKLVYLFEPNARYFAPQMLAISSRSLVEYHFSQGSFSFGNDNPPVRAQLDSGQYSIQMGAEKNPSYLDINVVNEKTDKTMWLSFGPEKTALREGETVYVGINPEASVPRNTDATVKLLKHATAEAVYATHLRLSLLDGMLVIEVTDVETPFGPAHNKVTLGRKNDIHPGVKTTRTRPLLGGVKTDTGEEEYSYDWYQQRDEEANDDRVRRFVTNFFGDSDSPVWEGDTKQEENFEYKEALEQHAIDCDQFCYMLGEDVWVMQYHELYVAGEWRMYLKSGTKFGLQKEAFLDLLGKLKDAHTHLREDRIQAYMVEKRISDRKIAERLLFKREMSKAFHPDIHTGDETAAMQFRMMNELLSEDCPYDPEVNYNFIRR